MTKPLTRAGAQVTQANAQRELALAAARMFLEIEAMWKTEPAPAAFTAFGFPDQRTRETHFAVHIPMLLGLIGTSMVGRYAFGAKHVERAIATGFKESGQILILTGAVLSGTSWKLRDVSVRRAAVSA